MEKIFNSFSDIKTFIAEQNLCSPELYEENYIEIVSEEFKQFLDEKNYVYGSICPEISDAQFWNFFEKAEILTNKHEDL